MDVVLMNLFVKVFGWNELVSKLINEVLVSTFNFLFCFLVVFRKKKQEGEQ
jgi:putative flippase GtrA